MEEKVLELANTQKIFQNVLLNLIKNLFLYHQLKLLKNLKLKMYLSRQNTKVI